MKKSNAGWNAEASHLRVKVGACLATIGMQSGTVEGLIVMAMGGLTLGLELCLAWRRETCGAR